MMMMMMMMTMTIMMVVMVMMMRMSTREDTGRGCSGLLPNPACSGKSRQSSRHGAGTLSFPFLCFEIIIIAF